MTMLTRAAILSCLVLSSPVLAASEGTPGATSSGSITITAAISARVSLTKLSDVSFGDGDLEPAIADGNVAIKSQSICVWSNSVDRSYFVTASGSGPGFALVNGHNRPIAYSVRWNQSAGQTNGTPLAENARSGQFRSSAVKPDCGGGTSASLIVRIAGRDAHNMLAGTAYAGTLTLVVSPD